MSQRFKILLLPLAATIAFGACGPAESVSRTKNAALATTPVLANPAFESGKGAWESTAGNIERGCLAGGTGPSLNTAPGGLVFGGTPDSVTQTVVVPRPGIVQVSVLAVTGTSTKTIFGPKPKAQSVQLVVSDTDERRMASTADTGWISQTVTTKVNSEAVEIRITGVGSGYGKCPGPTVRVAQMTFVPAPAPTTTTSTLPPTTTTSTIPPTDCNTAKACKIGEVGPGGGRVVYVAPIPQPWGQFIEAAPAGWSQPPGSDFPTLDPTVPYGCPDSTAMFETSTAIGAGKTNTEKILAACAEKGTAAQLASNYRGGGKSDWYLPSKDEVQALYDNRFDRLLVYYASSSGSHGQALVDVIYTVDGSWRQQYTRKVDGRDFNAKFDVRPVRAFGPVGSGIPPTTTTLAPKACSATACEIGNVGPGGGIVFYVAPTEQPWGRYLEAAPASWTGNDSAGPFGCQGTTIPGADGVELGAGKQNTRDIIAACDVPFSAARSAANYGGGGTFDWYLPSRDEAIEMAKRQSLIGGIQVSTGMNTSTCYWTSTEVDANSASCMRWGSSMYSSTKGIDTLRKDATYDRQARPIRAFSSPSQAPVTTSTTIPPTTTTVAPCSTTCLVGDTGPGGGIVFYAAASRQPWGQYLEVAPPSWGNKKGDLNDNLFKWQYSTPCPELSSPNGSAIGTGKSNTADVIARCPSAAGFYSVTIYTGGGKNDWFVPSQDELEALGAVMPTINAKAKLTIGTGYPWSRWYWSSTNIDTKTANCRYFGDNSSRGCEKTTYGVMRPIRAF